MYNVSIEFKGFAVTGWADLCGPYAECEGSEVTSVTHIGEADVSKCLMSILKDSFIQEALSAVEADALKQHNERFAGHGRPDDYDYHDAYDDYCASRGGDYWISEDGEYRCG